MTWELAGTQTAGGFLWITVLSSLFFTLSTSFCVFWPLLSWSVRPVRTKKNTSLQALWNEALCIFSVLEHKCVIVRAELQPPSLDHLLSLCFTKSYPWIHSTEAQLRITVQSSDSYANINQHLACLHHSFPTCDALTCSSLPLMPSPLLPVSSCLSFPLTLQSLLIVSVITSWSLYVLVK